jgi:hypothetical protein
MIKQNSVAYTGFVSWACYLEGHEFTIRGNDGIRSLIPFIVIEIRQSREVLSRTVEAKLPNIDIP